MPETAKPTNLATILAHDGIVIRKIPLTTTEILSHRERPLLHNEEVVEIRGRLCIQRTKENSLGGKYFVTFKKDQYTTVQFSLRHDGLGDTIEEAYQDYFAKKSK